MMRFVMERMAVIGLFSGIRYSIWNEWKRIEVVSRQWLVFS
jgi:hypothetical protein